MPSTYRSIARWPKGVGINLGNEHNESDDTHDTREQAEATCLRLKREGFGCDHLVFPLSTRVEEIPCQDWKTETRPYVVLEGIEHGNRFYSPFTRGNDPTKSAEGETWYRVLAYASTDEEAQKILYPTPFHERLAMSRYILDVYADMSRMERHRMEWEANA